MKSSSTCSQKSFVIRSWVCVFRERPFLKASCSDLLSTSTTAVLPLRQPGWAVVASLSTSCSVNVSLTLICALCHAAGKSTAALKTENVPNGPLIRPLHAWKEASVVVVDSHIQRIVLATEETTVTQQVSHRPIKRQSRLWSQRGTKVNGSHHGDNPLLRPTGIQIATKSYAALQAMAPTNIKTVHQTSLLHSRATSIDSECCRLPTTSVLSKKPEKLRSNQF